MKIFWAFLYVCVMWQIMTELPAHVSLWMVWSSICTYLIGFTLKVIDSPSVYIVCQSVVSSSALSADSQGQTGHIRLHQGPLKGKCKTCTVCNGIKVNGIKSYVFKKLSCSLRLVPVFASNYSTSPCSYCHCPKTPCGTRTDPKFGTGSKASHVGRFRRH